jgi:clusterin-associated protein 1
VKELLKIANLLYEAARTPLGQLNGDLNSPSLDVADKLSQIKICRALASNLTEKGSNLHDILGKEVESRVRI